MVKSASAQAAGQSEPDPHRRLLFLGAFPQRPRSRQVAEDLALRLAGPWKIQLVSQRSGPLQRLIDQTRAASTSRPQAALIDLFGSRAFWPASLCAELLRLRRIPTVLHLHGGKLPSFAARHPRILARTLRGAARVVAPSQYLARELAHLAPVPIEVIANAIDTERYRRTSPRTDSGPLEVLWLRTFHPLYDPLTMIAAVERCLERGADLRLQMVGPTADPGCRAAVEQAASRLPEGRLRLGEAVAKRDVAPLMQRADVFVNTSLADNTPVTVIEALAAGCTIVSSRVGGVPDLIRHGETGLLVPAQAPEALADALLELLQRPEVRRRIAERGQEQSGRFDWSVTLPEWQRLFSEVVAS